MRRMIYLLIKTVSIYLHFCYASSLPTLRNDYVIADEVYVADEEIYVSEILNQNDITNDDQLTNDAITNDEVEPSAINLKANINLDSLSMNDVHQSVIRKRFKMADEPNQSVRHTLEIESDDEAKENYSRKNYKRDLFCSPECCLLKYNELINDVNFDASTACSIANLETGCQGRQLDCVAMNVCNI